MYEFNLRVTSKYLQALISNLQVTYEYFTSTYK